MKLVKVFGKEYKIKGTLRAFSLFEELSGISIFNLEKAGESLTMSLMFLYALLAANNQGFMSYSDFLDAWDDEDDAMYQVGVLVTEVMEDIASSITDSVEKAVGEEDEKTKKK